MSRITASLCVLFLSVIGVLIFWTPVFAGAGQIRITVRNDFSTNITSADATVTYGCGGGNIAVVDNSGYDVNSTSGVIVINPVAAASCDDGDTLTIRVSDLGDNGYLDWTDSGTFSSTSENAFVTMNQFSVLANLTDEFSVLEIESGDAAGTFVVTGTGATTVLGILSPDNRKIGIPVPVGTADGKITVTGLGAKGYLNTTVENITVPGAAGENQRAYSSKNKYSVLAIGMDELSGILLGSGGSGIYSNGNITCINEPGTHKFGCPVPVGSGAGNVSISRSGYVDDATDSISPPSSASGTQGQVVSSNQFPIRVLGIASEFGVEITPTTSTPPVTAFLASGIEILSQRYTSSGGWYISATPGSAQLTSQVEGYANTAVRVQVGTVGQVTVDFDKETGTKWSADVDGPPLPAGMHVALYDTLGAPVEGASVKIFTDDSYTDVMLADDLRVSTPADARRQTGPDGLAKFALPTGTFYAQIIKGGLVSWGSASDPKRIGYLESGGPYRYTLSFETGSANAVLGTQIAPAAVSATKSTITATPLSVPADGLSTVSVTVSVRDENSAAISGRTVTMTTGRSGDIWNTPTAISNTNGIAVFQLKSTTTGTAIVTAIADGITIIPSLAVSFTTGDGTLTPGTLIKIPNDEDPATLHDTAVYYYGADGKRHAFPNDKVYFTWYDDFSPIRVISESHMASLTLGSNVTYRPGVKLVKFYTLSKTYAVSRGGEILWVETERVARDMYGDDWGQKIDDINDAFFDNYHLGSKITDAAQYNPVTEQNNTIAIYQDRGW